MRDLRGHLVAILSGVAMLIVGISLLFSVVGLRAGMADFSTVVTGLITSAYFAGYVAGVFFCPALITRVGHIRAFAAMASIASTMPILHAVWINPWFWGGLRLVTGICLVGLYIVIESWLNTLAPKDQRGRVFSMYLFVSFMALAVGQWLILVGDSVGFLPFAMVSVLLSFALLPITLAPVTQPDAVEPPRLSISSLWHTTPLGVSGAFASGLIHSAFFGLGALFAQRVGLDSAGVASFMAATILGGAIFQWPVGHLSDRIDRRLVLLSALLIAAVLSLLAYSSSLSWTWALVPIGVALGGALFTVYGLSVAHANDMVDVSRTLEVTGGLLLVHGIGAAIGPTLAGLLMDAGGPGSLMLYFSAVCAVLAVHALLRIRAVPPVAAEDKVGYVVVGSGMESALQQLDPRTPDPSEHDMADTGGVDADAAGDVSEQPSQITLAGQTSRSN
jgi:MFS family permease